MGSDVQSGRWGQSLKSKFAAVIGWSECIQMRKLGGVFLAVPNSKKDDMFASLSLVVCPVQLEVKHERVLQTPAIQRIGSTE